MLKKQYSNEEHQRSGRCGVDEGSARPENDEISVRRGNGSCKSHAHAVARASATNAEALKPTSASDLAALTRRLDKWMVQQDAYFQAMLKRQGQLEDLIAKALSIGQSEDSLESPTDASLACATPATPYVAASASVAATPSVAASAATAGAARSRKLEDIKHEHDLRERTFERGHHSIIEGETLSHHMRHLMLNMTAVRRIAHRCASSFLFELVSTVGIVVNALTTGIQADWSIKNPGQSNPTAFMVVEMVCLGVFTLEVLTRIVADGRKFLTARDNPNFNWNIADIVLLSTAYFNAVVDQLDWQNARQGGGVSLEAINTLRFFRILRLVRLLRAIKVSKQFRELRIMVGGILNCGKALFWAVVILMSISYTFSIFCLTFSAQWLADPDREPNYHAERLLDQKFSSMWMSLYTLFAVVTGGLEWAPIATQFSHISPILVGMFPMYIVITVFCVTNVITAVFVEAAEHTSAVQESLKMAGLQEQRRWLKNVEEVFAVQDKNGDRAIDYEEWQTMFNSPRSRIFFEELGLDLTNVDSSDVIFRMFDFDDSGAIDIDEFAHALCHVRGNARAFDLHKTSRMIETGFQQSNEQVESLQRALDQLCIRLEALTGTGRTDSKDRCSSMDVSPRSHSSVTAEPLAGNPPTRKKTRKERNSS